MLAWSLPSFIDYGNNTRSSVANPGLENDYSRPFQQSCSFSL